MDVILNLYTDQLKEALAEDSTSTAIPPESVLIIGHSIGGLVARYFNFNLFDANIAENFTDV